MTKMKSKTLPTPDRIVSKTWAPYRLTGTAHTLIFNDVHINFHDKKALEVMVHFIKAMYGDTLKNIIMNGDIADFYTLSRWVKDPRFRNFKQEVEYFIQFLEYLREWFPKTNIVYKYGNHEERYEDYLKLKAPELFDLEITELSKLLKLDNFGIHVVRDKMPIKLNSLMIIHGHEFRTPFTNPVNPARGLFLRAQKSAMCGHYHQSSTHSEKNIEGESITCWSLGCLSDLNPQYMPLNKWNLGFAVVDTSGNKKFNVHNYKLINYEVFTA